MSQNNLNLFFIEYKSWIEYRHILLEKKIFFLKYQIFFIAFKYFFIDCKYILLNIDIFS